MPPRTIDNLGVDVSTRYAQDQKTLDKAFIKEAPAIPRQTEVEVTTPFLSAETEALLQTQRTNLPWASFTPPTQYSEQRKRLFSYQLIPSLGSEDRQESQAQKILAKFQSLTESNPPHPTAGAREQYEAERTKEEEEREKNTLTSLLTTINTYDKLIIDVNSRRSQYQKG